MRGTAPRRRRGRTLLVTLIVELALEREADMFSRDFPQS